MAILDPILNPLLSIEPVYSIALISFVLSFVSILASKYLTNQKLMKQHRKDMKVLQKKAQEMSKKDPQKAMGLQKEMMDMNMVVMKESFKPMLITIVPFLLVFAWLNANLSYLPIEANEPFTITADLKEAGFAEINLIPDKNVTYISNQTQETVDKTATWELQGPAGTYTVRFNSSSDSVEQDLIIGETYETPMKAHSGSIFKKTTIGNEPLRLKLLGINMKWIWGYVLFSLMFSIILRKALKVA